MKNYLKCKNITYQFVILFFVLIFIPISFLSLMAVRTYKKQITTDISNESNNSIYLFNQNFDNIRTDILQLMITISQDDILEKFIRNYNSYDKGSTDFKTLKIQNENHLTNVVLSNAYGKTSFLSEVSIINKDGLIYTSFPFDGITNSDISYQEISELYKKKYFDLFLKTSNKTILWEFCKQNTEKINNNKDMLFVMRKIGDSTYGNSAIVILAFDCQNMWKNLQNFSELYSWVIFDENGNIGTVKNNKFSDNELLNMEASSLTKDKPFFYTTSEKKNYLIATTNDNNLGYRLMEIKSTSAITKQMYKLTIYSIIIIVTIMLLFGFFLLIIINSIVHPIHKLSIDLQHLDVSIMKTGLYLPKNRIKLDKDKCNNEIFILEKSYKVMYKNIKTLIEENLSIEKMKKNAEMQALQSQINPHFIFNTLSSVRFSLLNKNYDKASKLLLDFILLIDQSVVDYNEFITLGEQINNVKVYLDMMSLRYDKKFWISYNNIASNARLPKLILQPIVENSIMHGYVNENEGEIQINCSITEKYLLIEIRDFGIGFDTYKKNNKKENHRKGVHGIALSNIKERLILCYGDDANLNIESSGETKKGTKITIIIPIGALDIM